MEIDWRKRLTAELEAQGRDMKEVSLSAGLGETYIRDALKRGRGGKLDNLSKIAVALGRPPDFFTVADVSKMAEPRLLRPEPNASSPMPAPEFSRKRLPVYGQAIGGDDGRFAFNGELIDTVSCPPGLENVPNAYAVFVSGESMVPAYRPGDTVWVHPTRPPRRGDDVVVQMHPANSDDPVEGYIKEFVSWTPTMLVLKQHNPAREIEIERQAVVSVHKIIGSLRG